MSGSQPLVSDVTAFRLRGSYSVGPLASWRSGYAAACKAVYTGSIPVDASANRAPHVRGSRRSGGMAPSRKGYGAGMATKTMWMAGAALFALVAVLWFTAADNSTLGLACVAIAAMFVTIAYSSSTWVKRDGDAPRR